MRTFTRLLLLTLLLAFSQQLSAQVKEVTFREVELFQRGEKRIVMVLIGAEWCKYCDAMKRSVLKDKRLTGILDKAFYNVFLNADNKDDIIFAGRKFTYKPSGINTGVHELVEELGTINKQISFPSVCFLNEKNEIIYQHAGYLSPVALGTVLETLARQNQ
jgi:thioredoxin-related protein